MYPLRSRPALAFMFLIALCAFLMPPVTAACTEPTVDFTFDTGTPPNCPPFPVSFTDRTVVPAGTSVTGVTWNFDDGETSTKKNPVHSYATHGSYTVALKITSTCGAPKIKTKSVSVWCKPPEAGFSVDKDTGNAPLSVHITDTSQNYCPGMTHFRYTNTYDGTIIGVQNPSMGFPSAGTYWIKQQVSKTCVITPDPIYTQRKITVNPALTVYSVMNLSMPNVTSPTTTVTTTVTPTVTTTTTWTEPVAPVYVDTTTVSVPVTTAPTAAQAAPTTQQAATAGATPAPSQVPGTAAPGTGSLSVTTNPAGAQVFVDDVMWGATPATVPGLSAGPHTLRLVHPGYQNMSVPVTITDGKTAEYTFTLVPESGSGMGMLPVIAGVLVIAAGAGGAYWYTRKKGPGTGGQS